MFMTGFAIFLGLLLLLVKLPRRLALRLLHYDAWLDLAVTALVFLLHFGTFSGVMGATIAGLFTSVFTSVAKRVFGEIHDGKYFPGIVQLKV